MDFSVVSNAEFAETQVVFRDLEGFLAAVERRAFLMARVALGNDNDALDIVQDTMLVMVRKYQNKPSEEWRPLFFRVLQNRIRDLYRYRKVRSRFAGWLGSPFDGEDDSDPFQQVADVPGNNPAVELESRRSMEAVSTAVAALPRRQQQAFMLRCWEGLSTADTATAMGCSEGSVKTHYFRALQALQEALKEHYHG
ncbi:MAG: RNA polymerase sigma factor [Bacteroidales bacterium]|nr:RNA polymerase sigma factor [Bacteroidales bacterium]